MDPAISVDELSDAHIGRNAAESICVMERHPINTLEHVDHTAHGNACSVI